MVKNNDEFIPEKVHIGAKNNYKAVFNMSTELKELMTKAMKRLEEGDYEVQTMNTFIRSAVRNYAQMVLGAKKIGKTFETD
jgi:hypothetical protein